MSPRASRGGRYSALLGHPGGHWPIARPEAARSHPRRPRSAAPHRKPTQTRPGVHFYCRATACPDACLPAGAKLISWRVGGLCPTASWAPNAFSPAALAWCPPICAGKPCLLGRWPTLSGLSLRASNAFSPAALAWSSAVSAAERDSRSLGRRCPGSHPRVKLFGAPAIRRSGHPALRPSGAPAIRPSGNVGRWRATTFPDIS